MKRKALVLTEVLGVAVLLFGCGVHSKKETKAETSVKTTKKVSSTDKKKVAASSSSTKVSSSTSSASSASSSSQQPAKQENESGIDDTGFKQTPFPSAMQGTWYGWDKYSNSIKSVTFSGNKWATSGEYGNTVYAYDGAVRTASDKAALENPGQDMDQNKQEKWAAYSQTEFSESPISQNGQPVQIVNLRGWYQSAGDGTYYYLTTVDINGQPTQVLTEASGAGIWVQMHYYHSQSVAASQKDAGIDTDINQGEDYDG